MCLRMAGVGVGAYTAPDPCTPRPSKLVASTATRDFSYLKNVFCARARRAGAMRGGLIYIKSDRTQISR